MCHFSFKSVAVARLFLVNRLYPWPISALAAMHDVIYYIQIVYGSWRTGGTGIRTRTKTGSRSNIENGRRTIAAATVK